MIVTDDNEYVIFESSVLLPGGGNDILNLDKKRFDLLRGGYCVGDTGPGFFSAKNGQKILPKSSLC